MRHTREEVIKRTVREFEGLDRLVNNLTVLRQAFDHAFAERETFVTYLRPLVEAGQGSTHAAARPRAL